MKRKFLTLKRLWRILKISCRKRLSRLEPKFIRTFETCQRPKFGIHEVKSIGLRVTATPREQGGLLIRTNTLGRNGGETLRLRISYFPLKWGPPQIPPSLQSKRMAGMQLKIYRVMVRRTGVCSQCLHQSGLYDEQLRGWFAQRGLSFRWPIESLSENFNVLSMQKETSNWYQPSLILNVHSSSTKTTLWNTPICSAPVPKTFTFIRWRT